MNKPTLLRVTTVPVSLWKLLDGQLAHMTRYFNVHTASSSGKELEDVKSIPGIHTHIVEMHRGISPIKDIGSIFSMIKVIKVTKPDIIHSHTPKAGLVAMVAAAILGKKLRLHTVAGLPLETRTGLKKKILLLTERFIYKLAFRVYPNSKGLIKIIEENNLAKQDKIKMLGYGSSNGIDLNWYKTSEKVKEDARTIVEQYQIGNAFVFLNICRLVADKGINELVAAFNKFSKKYHNVVLLLLGNRENELDPLTDETEKLIEENENIIFAGYQKDVRPFLDLADCFIFPSHREGLPNVVLQAGAFGLPIIASRITGNTDIVEDGVNGILVEKNSVEQLEKAMKEMYENESIRKQYGNKLYETVLNNYDQKKLWAAIKAEYDQLLEN